MMVLAVFLLSGYENQPKVLSNNEVKTSISSLDELGAIADNEIAKNPRYKELTQKSRNNNLSPKEKKELDDITSTLIINHSSGALKKRDLSNYNILTFDDKRCKKCKSAILICKEAAKDLGIEVVVINPAKFSSYVQQHNLPKNNLDVNFLLDAYSDEKFLERRMRSDGLAIFLEDRAHNKVDRFIDAFTDFNNKNSAKADLLTWLDLVLPKK